MRTIKVTGKGKIKVRPDVTRITLNLEGKYKDYSDTLERSSEETEMLKNVLEPFGFGRSDLKTLSFNIDAEYEGYQEEGVYKQRFIGYRYRHSMKVEFFSDKELLGKMLKAIAECSLHPEFSLSYTVKDAEAVKNELLGKAVKDSAAKAAVLADAAGVTLGDIQSIDYSWSGLELEVRPMSRGLMANKAASTDAYGFAPDVEPDDISIEDNVTITWEIR